VNIYGENTGNSATFSPTDSPARVIASKFEERGLLGGSLDREQLGAVLHEHPL
jgi:hypothetical protein